MIALSGHLPAAFPMLAWVWGPVEVSEPLYLFLLLAIVPVVFLWQTSRVPASPARRWTSLILRLVLVVSLVMSLAGLRISWRNRGICVAFLLDASQSVPASGRDAMRAKIQEQIDHMDRDDQFVVIEFGGDAVLSSLPSPRGKLPQATQVADTGRTDIARALRLAMASFPADHQKRVVLFSDGNQNVGDAMAEARIDAANDIDVNVVPLRLGAGHEVMVDQLILPPRVQKNTRFQARAIVSADQAQGAGIRVFRDGQLISTMQKQLVEGSNIIDIDDSLQDGGTHQYSVTVEPNGGPDADTFAANNTAYAFTQVEAPGKVLVVRGNADERDYISEALLKSNLQVDPGPVGVLPGDAKGYTPYDCVVLQDVPATSLSNAQLTRLKEYVMDSGGGLVIIGGKDSFGPGGYKSTPLEEVSPLDMDVKRKKHMASLAMVIVLDKSGSMGASAGGTTKMALANQGAVETLKLLDETDEALIGEVDTEVKWQNGMDRDVLLPMNDLNKGILKRNTTSTQAGGGGIYAKTALYHAYRAVTSPKVESMARHVILFADTADTEQQEDCIALAKKYFAMDPPVTTTVIGLGETGDPDVAFQQELAKAGGGRWYITDDATKLPRIFAKETFIAARSAFVEKAEGIAMTLYNSPLLDTFKNTGLPRIYGYVGTTLKPRATLAAHGLEADDPVLAHWSVGLGKCVAFTGDATGRWGKDWVQWDGFSKFWAQTVRWASKSLANSQLLTSTTIDGTQGRIVVEAAGNDGKPINNLQLSGNVQSPDADDRTQRTRLTQVAPGRYEGTFNVGPRGAYMVNVVDQTTSTVVDNGGAVLSYPPEFRDLTANVGLLKAMAQTTSGQVLDAPEGVFVAKPVPVRTFWQLWDRLILVSAIGLLIDVAWRRLNFGDWLRRKPALVMATATGATIGAYKQVRTGRQQVNEQSQSLRQRIAQAAATPAIPLEESKPIAVLDDATNKPQTPAATAAPEGQGEGYANRLMGAKRRAAEQIRDAQEKRE